MLSRTAAVIRIGLIGLGIACLIPRLGGLDSHTVAAPPYPAPSEDTAAGGSKAGRATPPADFARDIFPILRRSCFECHGAEKQLGDLRLDQRDAVLDAGYIVIPGDPQGSELIRRITLPQGHDEIMPAVGERLKAREIELLRRWVSEGARWPDNVQAARHWAYVPPSRPPLPDVHRDNWCRNPIDRFILARLEASSLEPNPEADRAALLRRLSLDLTGLPPSPEELDAFLADTSADAYERAVDALLARPQFGQRWARPWLDLARYADSHGFQRDDLREIWAYRDWVVQALNADMPFDQFTIEQLAGDLLPDVTESQRVATGFHRCTPTNVEAGSIPEETRINQVIDRVNTTGVVWLGTTLECAQCHDHKYDPFTQRDYYRLLAFYNNTESEAERSNPNVLSSIRFLGPSMPLADEALEAQRRGVQTRVRQIQSRIAARRQELDSDLTAWAAEAATSPADEPQSHVLEVVAVETAQNCETAVLEDGSVLLTGPVADRDTYTVTVRTAATGIRALKLEALTHETLPGKGPGRGDAQRPNFVLHSFHATAEPEQAAADVEGGAGGNAGQEPTPLKFAAAKASFSQARYDVAGAVDGDPATAWAINPRFGQDHWAVFEAQQPFGYPGGTRLTVRMVQNYGGGRTIGRFRLSALTGPLSKESTDAKVVAVLNKLPKDWKPADRKILLDHRASSDTISQSLRKQLEAANKELDALKPDTTLVMRELEKPRMSAIFDRGDYRRPKAPVTPGVPEVLHPLTSERAASSDSDSPSDGASETDRPSRLTLARWLVDKRNPLVARVTVNRWWAEIFGQGIVTTAEDFGLKGELPTHPELLDWLAVEFTESGWSMKHMIKTMVMSAAYRQSSIVTPERFAKDDRNLLVSRGPRFRMDAEMIRDNALAIAGLLSLKQGGPPIRPHQPEGIWTKVGGQQYKYEVSPGEDRYRRGLYVVVKRGSPYPSFINFDATARLACTVQRSRTNTPLQALTLLNDPVYVEASLAFARRVLIETPETSDQARLDYAFRLCTARQPTDAERQTLLHLLRQQRQAADADQAQRLIGDFKVPTNVTPTEFSAWYAVATTLLNLDETITKE